MKELRNIAIAGNILFVLWMLWNAMDEGSAGMGPVQYVAVISLMCLLTLNAFLLSRRQS